MRSNYPKTPSVAVLGGGVGGLSAAQELSERGFKVTVVEARDQFGGKARSALVDVDKSEPEPLGEHGFRFFPGFYQHITDTMKRIPYEGNQQGVYDNLTPTTETFIASSDLGEITASRTTPSSPQELLSQLGPGFATQSISHNEARFLIERLLVLLTSCEKRRDEEFERVSWWEFINADEMSSAYQKNLSRSTQLLVALDPRYASARTVGQIYFQLLRGTLDPSLEAEQVLSGPTSELWIDPWIVYLESIGVQLHPNTSVRHIACEGERIASVSTETNGTRRKIVADFYVAALPVEAMCELMTDDIAKAAPSMAHLDQLQTSSMVGIQFLLHEDVPIAYGHELYPDSPWALTSISQKQFWKCYDIEKQTNGLVEGVLSVIISDWSTPGLLHEKPAKDCTAEEVKEEVWAQLQAHLNRDGNQRLDNENLYDWVISPSVIETNSGIENHEPLLVNTVDSLSDRPEAGTEINNLALAADYVRTNTDLACMEGANEAARRATNVLIERANMDADLCKVWDLAEPSIFESFKKQDSIGYRFGLPHPGERGKNVSLLLSRTLSDIETRQDENHLKIGFMDLLKEYL